MHGFIKGYQIIDILIGVGTECADNMACQGKISGLKLTFIN